MEEKEKTCITELKGTLEEYQKTIRRKDICKLIWEWTKKKNYIYYVNLGISMMREAVGTDKWIETRDDIRYCGPDNYSLNLPREDQGDVKFAWLKLIKYQFSIVYPRKKK